MAKDPYFSAKRYGKERRRLSKGSDTRAEDQKFSIVAVERRGKKGKRGFRLAVVSQSSTGCNNTKLNPAEAIARSISNALDPDKVIPVAPVRTLSGEEKKKYEAQLLEREKSNKTIGLKPKHTPKYEKRKFWVKYSNGKEKP